MEAVKRTIHSLLFIEPRVQFLSGFPGHFGPQQHWSSQRLWWESFKEFKKKLILFALITDVNPSHQTRKCQVERFFWITSVPMPMQWRRPSCCCLPTSWPTHLQQHRRNDCTFCCRWLFGLLGYLLCDTRPGASGKYDQRQLHVWLGIEIHPGEFSNWRKKASRRERNRQSILREFTRILRRKTLWYFFLPVSLAQKTLNFRGLKEGRILEQDSSASLKILTPVGKKASVQIMQWHQIRTLH